MKRESALNKDQLNVRIDSDLLHNVNDFRDNELLPHETLRTFVEKSIKMRYTFLKDLASRKLGLK